jgi:hypothetical protein
VLDDIDRLNVRAESRQFGLANSLAEQGSLPMYGMPTRVRNLYTGTRSTGAQQEWSMIDRDLDLAVFEFAPGSTIVKDKRAYLCIGFTGPLRGFIFKQPPGMAISPMTAGALGDPFWMLDCENCGAWRRYDVQPDENVGECRSCARPLEPGRARECREPLGFRTNFRPAPDVENEGFSGRNRSIQSEGDAIPLEPQADTNLSTWFAGGTKTYRLNRGPVDPNTPGRWLGFSGTSGQERYSRRGRGGRQREAFFEQQMVASDFIGTPDGPVDFRPYAGAEASQVEGIWLAAPKTTDALYLAPTVTPSGLDLARLVGNRSLDGLNVDETVRTLAATAVRAAALSATFILVNRAALKLDIDPEEFDVIEPRMVRPAGGSAVPLLQFADHLINGAGFCDALGTPNGTSPPLIATLLRSVVQDAAEYPLQAFLNEAHTTTCEQACYRCLLRYRNQPYHGLLDWRLGLAFLRTLLDASYRCGLSGIMDDDYALRDWPALVARDVRRVQRQFPDAEVRQLGLVWAIRFGRSRWAIVAHPLWETAEPEGALLAAIEGLGGDPYVVVDSFNLARRPVTIRSAVVEAG